VKTLSEDTHLKVALTGFLGPQRQALKLLILAIGAEYSESMSKRNTHLICQEKSGAKYLKALEWNIEVVDLSWLLNVSKCGYNGKK
jgi:NAD-dependent DNA ligase